MSEHHYMFRADQPSGIVIPVAWSTDQDTAENLAKRVGPYLEGATKELPGDLSLIDGWWMWRLGGVRDSRGHSGSLVTQVLRPEKVPVSPALFPRILGSDLVRGEPQYFLQQKLPAIGNLFEQACRPPRTGLADSAEVVSVVACALDQLRQNRGPVCISMDAATSFELWEAFWACLPPQAQKWFGATTSDVPEVAGWNRQTDLVFSASPSSAELGSPDPRIEAYVRSALLTYAQADLQGVTEWLASAGEFQDLAALLDWAADVPLVEGTLYPTPTFALAAMAASSAPSQATEVAKLVDRIELTESAISDLGLILDKQPHLATQVFLSLRSRWAGLSGRKSYWRLLYRHDRQELRSVAVDIDPTSGIAILAECWPEFVHPEGFRRSLLRPILRRIPLDEAWNLARDRIDAQQPDLAVAIADQLLEAETHEGQLELVAICAPGDAFASWVVAHLRDKSMIPHLLDAWETSLAAGTAGLPRRGPVLQAMLFDERFSVDATTQVVLPALEPIAEQMGIRLADWVQSPGMQKLARAEPSPSVAEADATSPLPEGMQRHNTENDQGNPDGKQQGWWRRPWQS